MPLQLDSSTLTPTRRASLFRVFRACIPGLLVLGAAGYWAQQRRIELETWPTVQAHVDSAAVIPWHVASRQASYAKRLWLTYSYDGHKQTRRVDGVYSNNWATAAHAVDDARARGTAMLLINPSHPSDITLDPGYTFDFFVWQVVLAGFGLVFLAIGLSSSMTGRRAGSAQPRTVGSGRAQARVPSPAFVAMVGVLFTATGIAILFYNVRRRVDWVAVTARVDSADVVQRRSDQHGTVYTPRSWIAYERDGHTYHLPVLTGAAWVRDPISTQHAAEMAWHAGPTRVFVNPLDPYQATLDPTSSGNLLLPIMFILVGCGCLALARYQWMARRRATG
jgi:hypothetical protein